LNVPATEHGVAVLTLDESARILSANKTCAGMFGWDGAATSLIWMDPQERLFLETVAVRASDNGGGASGESKYDVQINGAAIYTSFATEDQRPVIPFDASTDELIDHDGFHEVTELRRGDLVSFHTVTDPTGGDPERVECHLVCRGP
jgi:hypothetical protein